MKTFLLTMGLLTCGIAAIAQKSVSDIRIQQQDSLLYVFYNLKNPSDISLYFSLDDGKTFTGPLTNVTGDVGTDVANGTGKLIIWDIVKEIGYIDIDRARVKVVANQTAQQRTPRILKRQSLLMGGVAFNNNQLSYTLMYGQVKKWGWYGKVKSNFRFDTKDGFYDYRDPNHAPIFWSGENNNSRLAAMVGGIWNMTRPVMIYAGAGYGFRHINWETIGKQKIRMSQYSYQGAEIELGIIARWKKFLISAGISSNTKVIDDWGETDIAIGYIF